MVANHADLEARLSSRGHEAQRAISWARYTLARRRPVANSEDINLARQFLMLLGLNEHAEVKSR